MHDVPWVRLMWWRVTVVGLPVAGMSSVVWMVRMYPCWRPARFPGLRVQCLHVFSFSFSKSTSSSGSKHHFHYCGRLVH
jgi:hypothetical protein